MLFLFSFFRLSFSFCLELELYYFSIFRQNIINGGEFFGKNELKLFEQEVKQSLADGSAYNHLVNYSDYFSKLKVDINDFTNSVHYLTCIGPFIVAELPKEI